MNRAKIYFGLFIGSFIALQATFLTFPFVPGGNSTIFGIAALLLGRTAWDAVQTYRTTKGQTDGL